MKPIQLRLHILLCIFSFLVVSCDSGTSGDAAAGLAITQLLSGINLSGTSCESYAPTESGGIFAANQVISAPANTGIGFRNSFCTINGIQGLGKFNGSLDVFTLDASGPGASIVLGWSGKKVLPTSGIDFMVYENPFFVGVQNDSNPFDAVFMEPVIVEVGNDLTNWCGWNPAYTNSNPSVLVTNPIYWNRFAGITPFVYNQETNPMTLAEVYDTDIVNGGGGGDSFDLADSNFGASGTGCDSTLKNELQSNGFLYIKISSAKTLLSTLPIDSAHANPDIDGVIAKSISP